MRCEKERKRYPETGVILPALIKSDKIDCVKQKRHTASFPGVKDTVSGADPASE